MIDENIVLSTRPFYNRLKYPDNLFLSYVNSNKHIDKAFYNSTNKLINTNSMFNENITFLLYDSQIIHISV